MNETKTRFENETKGNSQMAYIIDRQIFFSYLGQSLEKNTPVNVSSSQRVLIYYLEAKRALEAWAGITGRPAVQRL